MTALGIDIVLPTNRVSPFLADGLAAVAAQTGRRARLIVVDDGSPDPEGLERHVRTVLPDAIVLRQPPSGVSVARNRGIAAGHAPYVTFLDDDDVWAPSRNARLAAALDEAPEAVAAFCGGWYLDASGTSTGDGWPALSSTREEMLSGAVHIPRIVALLVRRSALDSVGGFDPALTMAEDDDLILRLLQRGPMVAVPDRLVGYRRHDHNVTNAPFPRGVESSERMLRAQIVAARTRGEEDTARLLLANYRRFLSRLAEQTPGPVVHDLRHGRVADAVRRVVWVGSRAPGPVARAFLSRVAGMADRRPGR